MVTRTYDGSYTDEGVYREEVLAHERAGHERLPYRDVGATIFVWVVWAIAFAFWAFTMSSFFGILSAIAAAGPGSLMGGVDMGGGGYLLMSVLGLIILGLVMIWGAARYATRDRALDPLTEAATARLYDEGRR